MSEAGPTRYARRAAAKEPLDLPSVAGDAFFNRIDLSAHGFHAVDTKRCGFDWALRPGTRPDGTPDQTARGFPFNYFTQGVGCVEVELDLDPAGRKSGWGTARFASAQDAALAVARLHRAERRRPRRQRLGPAG